MAFAADAAPGLEHAAVLIDLRLLPALAENRPRQFALGAPRAFSDEEVQNFDLRHARMITS